MSAVIRAGAARLFHGLGPVLTGVAAALALSGAVRADMLPTVAAAKDALWAAPMVRTAQAELDASRLDGAALSSGSAEWTVSGDLAHRRVGAGGGNYGEWGASVSRPIRTPGRAAADRALGEAGVDYAEASLGEALHETGRELLRLWFDWLGEAQLGPFWQAQTELAERQQAAVGKRVKLGETAQREVVAAGAALAQARQQTRLAAQRALLAHGALNAAFPGLVEPATLDLPSPEPVPGDDAEWITAALEHNHELARARAEAARLERHAGQLRSRNTVEPNLGVFMRNENGNENVVGVNLGLTLPGAARRLDADAAQVRADAARATVAALEARLRAEAAVAVANARAGFEAWHESDMAAAALEESARLAARAFELGEGELADVLAARRLAVEARLAEAQQRRDAQYAVTRLELDTHRLWPLDAHPDEEDGHAHH